MENKTGRNANDVVMELLHLHIEKTIYVGDEITGEDIESFYLKYYELVNNNHFI
ncbi:hypothetical protein [Paraliobacillus sediminis]|uniref:hypothetical protein n=1 Tax=Paraliobacillus sediminis TaxID=1885916 RepID=UPI0013C33CD5|nr:hypothetical protein [Paraliobacillus sediminis]